MQPTSSIENGRPIFFNPSMTANAAPPVYSYCSPWHWHSSPVHTDMRETAEFAAFITTTESAAVALGDGDAKALSRRLIPVY